MRAHRNRPTIYTVARHAGVSIATVSRALSGGSRVREETERRVVESSLKVGYRPNGAARALQRLRHGSIGVVFPNLSRPYYAGVLMGVEEAANRLGLSVLIAGTQGRPGPEQLVLDLTSKVDGLVVFGRTVPDEMIAELRRQGTPTVLLARPRVDGEDTVRSENREAARALAAHLLEHGHKSIGFIGDTHSSPDCAERWSGFLAAHQEAGLAGPAWPELSALLEAEGYQVALRLLGADNRPTALFCANDDIATGAYAAARELKLRLPGDVAITGWDDVPTARYFSPPLTTVRQPLAELGARAAELLQARVEGDESEPVNALLPTEIVFRASCGCRSRRRPRGGASS
ncbi:MAG: LacI family DNA-binding transcriptional regulator [Candidatus Dormibacter sp.]|uniref:LacI family DNA-binding transcriptional regulator n=1 Tax=Candidatus Dormibacter sp. TaxID=2973982 RepID=UPI000DB6C962|nr:MAG: LacI family transcriptional regulator [Candidatus Dormibacteraeota bacterium]